MAKIFPASPKFSCTPATTEDWLLAAVGNGDGGQFAHYLMDADGKWTQITHFEDGIVSVKFGVDPALYLLSRKDAPRGQILRLPLAHLEQAHDDLAQAKVVVPQTPGGANESDRASIEDFVPTVDRLYVIDIIGGPSRVRVFGRKPSERGQRGAAPVFESMGEVPLPPISSVGRMIPIGAGDVLFFTSTYLDPPAWYRFDAAAGKAIRTALFRLRRSSSTTPKWCANSPFRKTAPAFPSTLSGAKAPSSTAPTRLCSTATAAMASASSHIFWARSRASGSIRAAFMLTPTCAAAPSTAKNGTSRAT